MMRSKDISAQVHEVGFALIKSAAPDKTSMEVATQIGSLLQLPGLAPIQTLRPHDPTTAPPNIYSGNFGFDAFPLHTDLAHWWLPPRYFLLRCVAGSSSVETHVLDGKCLIDEFGYTDLRRAIVSPRRPIGNRRALLRVLEEESGVSQRIRWDSMFVVPATKMSAATCHEIKSYLSNTQPTAITLASLGDTLLVDNWRMLHGRSPVPEDSRHRRIDRAYLGDLN